MEKSSYLLHKHKIFLDEPLLDVSGLVSRHHFLQSSSQPVSQNFSDQLSEAMHQDDGSVIPDTLSGL
jgi:hypothetical protein